MPQDAHDEEQSSRYQINHYSALHCRETQEGPTDREPHLIMTSVEQAPILLLALAVDAAVGDPAWLYRRVPHPVVWFGWLVGALDRSLNHPHQAAISRRAMGLLTLTLVVAIAGLAGWALQAGLSAVAGGSILEALVVSVFLAQNSLYRHVAAVAQGFTEGGVEAARGAVSLIVGRDPDPLDAAGICRSAIESLAENFSDGVVAPAFFYLLGGLPGLLAYKSLNTADSMIGHRTAHYREFGWAAARLDDIANFIPARLSALLISLAAAPLSGASPLAAWRAMSQDAKYHRSINAGWPEAAMAGALDLRLAGPRFYGGAVVEDAWMGDGRAEAQPEDITRALLLYGNASLFAIASVAALIFI